MSGVDPLELDRYSRREALDSRRSILLQAPAGSGKTTVLTARFLVLLGQVDAPEQILAITFTRKAAAEMRHRVLEALRAAQAGGQLTGIEPQVLAAAARREREGRWQLLRNASRLRIETIDALNHRLARSLPVAARSGTALTLTPAPEALYRDAARAALRHALQDPEQAAAARLWFDRMDNGWARLERLLSGMLARRTQWLPHLFAAPAAGLAARVEASLHGLLQAQLGGLLARFPGPLLQAARSLLAERAREPAALDADPSHLGDWRSLCALALTREGGWRRRLSSREGFGPGDQALKQRLRDWIAQAARQAGLLERLGLLRLLPDPRLAESDRQALGALTTLLLAAATELQLSFAERGVVDYPYVAAAARQALVECGEPSDVALRAGAALRHILVDEFQDTSVQQLGLLDALVAGWERGDGRTLFLVGDPMQSIYQFRDAEVGLFLRARDHGIGPVGFEAVQLRCNYRAHGALIAWTNECFGRLFPAEDDARLAAVRFLSATAPTGAPDAGAPPAHLLRFEPGDLDSEADAALGIVREQRRLQPAASIAVLVAAREHASRIVARLRGAGIAVRGVSLERLRERPVTRDLAALARALLHGADRTAWLALLRGPFCGLPLAQLERLAQAPGGDLFEALEAAMPADAAAAERIARLCAALRPGLRGEERGWPLWRRVQCAWLRLGGPAVYAEEFQRLDAQAFVDALAEHEDPQSLSAEGMEALTDGLYSTGPAQEGAIEVMTMHAAKGLEWDTVILPGLGRAGASDQDPLLHWIELPRGAHHGDLLLAPIHARGEEPEGSLAAYIRFLRAERRRLEQVRLLYVAATRARAALYLLGAPRRGAPGDPVEPNPGSLLAALWPALAAQFRALPVTIAAAARNAPQRAAGAGALWRLPEGWSLPRPPAPPQVQRLQPAAEAAATAPEYAWVGLTARAVGIVVHAELHRLSSLTALPAAAELVPDTPRYSEWLAELGVEAPERAGAAALVHAALMRTLADARGRWLLSGAHPQARSECRLSGPEAGRLMHVIIDRMLLDAQGTRWVIDYKSSHHEGGDPRGFLERELQRYAPQLRRYAALAARLGPEPVRAALYFPLLAAFRELEP